MSDGADEAVYEMLWDCGYCGTRKLLGVTHRYCPVCGGPQNADARYFPPESEKVPAKQHVYYGADVRCAACGEANSRNAKHCRACGAPLEGAKDVARRADVVAGEPPPPRVQAVKPSAAPKKKRSAGCMVVLALVLVVIVLIVVAFAWKKPSTVEVVAHRWTREIQIERFGPVQDSSWCDSMPAGARNVHRSRAVRDHRKVEDGEDCQVRKIDRGDGTYVEKEECTPRYRDEPIYDDKCTYVINRWSKSRREKAEGGSMSDAPRWPPTRIARTGQCEGCEREASRKETLTLVLRDGDGDEHTCDVAAPRWSALEDGTTVEAQVSVVTGSVACDTLKTR